jgi:hypothetical protein
MRNFSKLNGYAILRIIQSEDDFDVIMTSEFFEEEEAIQAFLKQQRNYVRNHMEYKERPERKTASKKKSTENNKEMAQQLITLATALLNK